MSRTLGHRELRRWWQEHSELDQLVEELLETITRGSVDAARASLEDFAESLAAHLMIEEDVYFPLVEELAPRHVPTLRAARLAHLELRAALDEIRDHLTEGDLDAACAALRKLLDGLGDHERLEADLIADLKDGGAG